METRKFRFDLLAVFIVLVMCLLCVQATAEKGIKWNEDANSIVLNTRELAKFVEAFPPWKIKQITFPSDEEISSKAVKVDEELKVYCIEWIKKFIKAEQLPIDINKHLVPMKNWGLITKESEQKRLCDVFVVRFKKDYYVIHIHCTFQKKQE